MAALRRLVLLVAVVVAAASYVWWKRRDEALDAGAPEWPPLPADGPTEPAAPAASTTPAAPAASAAPSAEQAWVAPVDGACPLSHPIKLNESSGIFHSPGGRFYERTSADRCYASAEAATADGYRASKA